MFLQSNYNELMCDVSHTRIEIHVPIYTNIGIVEWRSDDAPNLLSMGQIKNINIDLLASVLYLKSDTVDCWKLGCLPSM